MARLRAFRWRDIDGMLDVRNAVADREGGHGRVTREALAASWGRERAERDLWVMEAAERIVAYGGLRPWHTAGWLHAEVVVHPEWRAQGLGDALLETLVARGKERGAHWLGAVAPDEPAEAGHFLRQHGFEVFVRRQHMRLRPVVAPEVRPVGGHRLRLADVEESPVLAEVTNLAYSADDRVGQADAAGYRHDIETSGARVWVAERMPAREVVGLCEVYARDVVIDGRAVRGGHIGSLAVRPASRRQGLGRWLLAAGIRACQAANWAAVGLNVDCDNVPALALYEDVGFRPVYAYAMYRLRLA